MSGQNTRREGTETYGIPVLTKTHVIAIQGNQEQDASDVFEAMDPLSSLALLAADLEIRTMSNVTGEKKEGGLTSSMCSSWDLSRNTVSVIPVVCERQCRMS